MSVLIASAFDVLISEREHFSIGIYHPDSPPRLRADSLRLTQILSPDKHRSDSEGSRFYLKRCPCRCPNDNRTEPSDIFQTIKTLLSGDICTHPPRNFLERVFRVFNGANFVTYLGKFYLDRHRNIFVACEDFARGYAACNKYSPFGKYLESRVVSVKELVEWPSFPTMALAQMRIKEDLGNSFVGQVMAAGITVNTET